MNKPVENISIGISTRLLIISLILVMIGGISIAVPSMLRFVNHWGIDQIEAAHAQLIFIKNINHRDNQGVVPFDLAQDIFKNGRYKSIVAKEIIEGEEIRTIVLGKPLHAIYHFDFEHQNFTDIAFKTAHMIAFGKHDDVMQFSSFDEIGDENVKITAQVHVGVFLEAFYRYINSFLILLALLALIVAIGMFCFAHFMLIIPIQRLSKIMGVFEKMGENASVIVPQSKRRDEIGELESNFHKLQTSFVSINRRQRKLAMLGGAIARVNHDLRSIFATAHFLTQTLEQSSDKKVRQLAPTITSSLNRAVDLCASTLEYVHTPEPKVRRETVNLKALFRELEMYFFDQARVKLDMQQNHVMLKCDEQLLYRVFMNLITNAVKAEAKNITIKISSTILDEKDKKSTIIMDVIDDGHGIDPEIAQHIFEPFVSKNSAGGLGLAIAKELINLMEGDIWLKSSDKTGSCFRIEL
ncbi:MAG: HAMP domain-containing sensor histidine kinase [Pseudomonadota bacterium]